MNAEERALAAQATADEWNRLAGLTGYDPVRLVCLTKARAAERAAREQPR